MPKFLTLFFLLVSAVPAAAKAQTNISWTTFLSCDQMALQLRLDPLERRRVQVVVMNQAIIGYFSTFPNTTNALFYLGGPNRLQSLSAYAEAWVQSGIFSKNDFQGISIPAGSRASAQVPGLRLFLNSGGVMLNIVDVTGATVRNWYFRSCSWQ